MLAESYGPVALVTGASAGLGRETALALARKGLDVVLVARRADRLEEVAAQIRKEGRTATVIPRDLTEPGAIEQLVADVAHFDIGLVAPAAGFGHGGPHEAASLERHLQMLDLNCRAPLELVHRLLPRLKDRRRSAVLLYGSAIGFTGVPWAANYAATKAYIIALGEGLQVELAPHGVDVTVIAPGPANTEFFGVAGMTAGAAANPVKVAHHSLAAIGQRRSVMPDWIGWAIRWSLRTAPRWLAVRIVGRVMAGMAGVSR